MNMKRAVLPAEWEPQSGVMLTWPHAETDWAPYLDEICETYLQMAEAIARRERLLVVAPHAEETDAMLNGRLGKEMMQNVRIVELPTNDTWARDHGFITLRNADGTPLLLDFCFNGWGEKFDARLDNAINKGVIEWLMEERRALSDNCQDNNQTPLNAPHSTFNCQTIDFVLEGGSIESDGQGTIFTTTSCLLAPHRNQPLTKEQIDERLRQMLGADRIVWLDHGQLIGDDTDGHIDTIVRPCAHDTLLYIRCDNPNDEHYEDFKALPIYYDGERLPATYANFLIINGAVLVPTYRQPENDAKALETLQKAFPDREMVPIDSTIITRQHGSIHCCTMQIPKEMQF